MNRCAKGLVVVALGTMLGCGGGTTVATAPAGGGASDSAADRCLAIAGAKRERRADEPAKVTVKHVLVKYAGAKKAPDTVKRTRSDACLRAQEARSKLEAGQSFADVVRDYSEEQGATSREGSLGAIERSFMVPPFADAAFELHPGDVSHVVETEFGFHVIMRTE